MPLRQLLPNVSSLTSDEAKDANELCHVDIIAVHGLNPFGKGEEEHAWNTWRKPQGPNGHLWLRDDLKERAPAARVFLYQYNSRLVWGGDKANFLLKAEELLEAIRGERKRTPERPIIFIGHSLGGLLIQQALINAYNSKRYEPIKKATVGLVFFGTPHGGGNPTLVSIGSAAAKVARWVGAQKDQHIEETLQAGSIFTEIHQHLFKNHLLDCPIISFWEGYGEVVPRNSAIYGMPDDKEVIIEIKADHSNMCRFDGVSAHDKDNFKTVWGALEDMYDSAIQEDKPTLQQALNFLSNVLETILPLSDAIRRPPSTSKDLSWFTNTTKYHAWIAPARGDPAICSRFLIYAGKDVETFADIYARSEKLVEADVLYLDCQMVLGLTETVTPAGELLNLTAIGLGMWILIGQALQDRQSQGLLAALHECCNKVPDVATSVNMTGTISLSLLGELLKRVLNYRPTQDAVIILDRLIEVERDDLYLLRNVVQDVLDQQRRPEAAPTRSIVIGKREDTINFVFKGTAEIDEMSEYQECLRALGFEKMGSRRCNVTKADIGTNHWLWDHEAFKNWNENSSAILWIVGKPGSGKSVLAGSIQDRFLADMARKVSQASEKAVIIAAWFYSERESLKSHAFMLRAVLLQILDQDRDIFKHAAPIYRLVDPFDAWNGVIWTIEILKRILEQIILAPERYRPVLLILDGLDESEYHRGTIEDCLSPTLQFLCRLVEKATQFKIIFLSRNHPEIERRLRNHYRIVMQDVNEPDIIKVIDNGIESLLRVLRDDESSEDEVFPAAGTSGQSLSQQFQYLQQTEQRVILDIRAYLLQYAEGVILWVKTCLAALESKAEDPFPLQQLAKELQVLPTAMQELYQKMVKQLAESLKTSDSKTMAHRAVTWIRKASETRGLRLIEIFDALSIPADIERALQSTTDPFLGLAGVHTVGSIRRRLLRLCGPFVEIIKAPTQSRGNEVAGEDPSDQVQLIHQTAKKFLETDPNADFLRMPDNVHEVILQESRDYLHISFPVNHLAYDPLPSGPMAATNENVTTVLEYLERKPLLSYIFNEFEGLQAGIPDRYRSIFQHTTTPPKQNIDELKVIAEMYFHIACSRGWATALENLICLQTLSLEDRSSAPDWYLFENSAIQGALRAAIRRRLLPEIRFLAWYVAERGLDLLDFPTEGREDTFGNSVIIKEAIETGSEEIALVVIGYADEPEKESLLAWLQHYKSTATYQTADEADIRWVQKAIWTVIQFWGSPPKRLRRDRGGHRFSGNQGADDDGDDANNGNGEDGSGSKFGDKKDDGSVEDDGGNSELGRFASKKNVYGADIHGANHYGANLYGANLYGANLYGANVYGMNLYGANNYIAPLVGNELNRYGMDPDQSFFDRLTRLSHGVLANQCSILRGGRNLYNPRLPKIPRYGPVEPMGVEESAYVRGKLTATTRSQYERQKKTTEEDFAQKMNDAAWRTMSSAASDKIQ